MKEDQKKRRVLIIDKQDYWRGLSEQTLRDVGFTVDTRDTYDWPPLVEGVEAKDFDLVILGCVQIEDEEKRLISRILENGAHLLVLCTSLPWMVMRSLFLAGADDVTNKPYDPERLTSIVQQVLNTINPCDSYRATKQKGIR